MKTLFKKTALVSVLTLASRILGLVRDALIAMCFGTSSQTDAFFIAFRPFDLVRKLFSEGILGISFVPTFSGILEKKGKNEAAAMVFSFFCFLSLAGVLIVLAGIFFAPWVIHIIAPGFVGLSYTSELTLLLLKIMLPYFWLVLITALCMGVLNSFQNFGVPALAPIVFNMVVIGAALFIAPYFNPPVTALAVGVTLGGVVQLAVQVPFMIRVGMLKPSFFKVFHPGMRRILKITLPCMIGAASYQINIMVASFFASTLKEGSVSFIYYADRMVQFPLALFAVSVATVLLPELSRKVVSGRQDEIADLFSNGVMLVLFVTIPAMAGLMALDQHIIALLFGHGAFEYAAVQKTAESLFFLVIGLWAFTGIRLFVTLYYALDSIRIPFYAGVLSNTLNIVFCYVLIDRFGIKGLVFSVSLSAMIGFVVLFVNIPGNIHIHKQQILVSACRSLFISVIMFVLVRQAAAITISAGSSKIWMGTGVIGCIFVGVLFYFGMNLLISSPELKLLKKGMIRP